MSTPTSFSGGCACGSIRYQSTAQPLLLLNCHCQDCQRASGGPFSSFVLVPADAFQFLEGSPRLHPSPSAMGGMTRRAFCPDCGTPIMGKSDAVPQVVAIRTASLDDPSWCATQMNVWTCDAQPWAAIDPALPQHDKYPQ